MKLLVSHESPSRFRDRRNPRAPGRLPLAVGLLMALTVCASWSAAGTVDVRYHADVWPCDPKEGIQFFSPTEGYVGVYGFPTGRGKPPQAYLLATTEGPSNLQSVATLPLPANHALRSFFFLNRQMGWVVASEMKAGGGPSRLWRTTDQGKTWEELSAGLPPGGGRLQFVNPAVGWLLRGSLWRTDDGGLSWRELPSPPQEHDGFLSMLFVDPREGWLTGNGVIYHTSDGGETWTLRYALGRKGLNWVDSIQFPSRSVGWAVVGSMPLVTTTDSGQTWRPIRARHPQQGPFDRFTSLHFLSPDMGVLAGQHNERERVSPRLQREASPIAFRYYRPYVLVTFDGGRSWTYHSLPIPVGQWSQVGTTLYGINSVDGNEPRGVVEIRLQSPAAKTK